MGKCLFLRSGDVNSFWGQSSSLTKEFHDNKSFNFPTISQQLLRKNIQDISFWYIENM